MGKQFATTRAAFHVCVRVRHVRDIRVLRSNVPYHGTLYMEPNTLVNFLSSIPIVSIVQDIKAVWRRCPIRSDESGRQRLPCRWLRCSALVTKRVVMKETTAVTRYSVDVMFF